MVTKLKKAVCVVCAFAASFLLTVTAYSETYATNDVVNSNYLGKYTNDYTPGYILANAGSLELFAYMDEDRVCFVSGSVNSYQLKLGDTGFFAIFPTVKRVNMKGEAAVGPETISEYTASGDVSGVFTKKIASKQSTLVYSK